MTVCNGSAHDCLSHNLYYLPAVKMYKTGHIFDLSDMSEREIKICGRVARARCGLTSDSNVIG